MGCMENAFLALAPTNTPFLSSSNPNFKLERWLSGYKTQTDGSDKPKNGQCPRGTVRLKTPSAGAGLLSSPTQKHYPASQIIASTLPFQLAIIYRPCAAQHHQQANKALIGVLGFLGFYLMLPFQRKPPHSGSNPGPPPGS